MTILLNHQNIAIMLNDGENEDGINAGNKRERK